ncbi:MAG TPA: hypothetical protein VK254_01040 [Candidatus Bathyarchaeia archaeon]|nr:hypothetical protein [Candidatus Bathyarchaeia archaeon]
MLKKIDKKIVLLIVVAVLLAGGLIWLAVFKQLENIKKTSDNIQKEQLDSLVRDERSQKILELGKELGNMKKSQEEMSSMFVDKNNAVPFLEMLEKVSATTGNSIKISFVDLTKMKSSTAPKPAVRESDETSEKDVQQEDKAKKAAAAQVKKPDFSNQLGFLIELTGEYRSLVDFLTKIENMPYFVRIYNFQTAPLVAKNQAVQSAGGNPAANPGNPPSGSEGESKLIKTNLTIGVYTNGGK